LSAPFSWTVYRLIWRFCRPIAANIPSFNLHSTINDQVDTNKTAKVMNGGAVPPFLHMFSWHTGTTSSSWLPRKLLIPSLSPSLSIYLISSSNFVCVNWTSWCEVQWEFPQLSGAWQLWIPCRCTCTVPS
jgi:hypothetical protein